MKERYKIPVACYLVLLQDEQVLLQKRQNTGYADGMYGLVSWHKEENESVSDSMVKEPYEEAGIILRIGDLEVWCVIAILISFACVSVEWAFAGYAGPPIYIRYPEYVPWIFILLVLACTSFWNLVAQPIRVFGNYRKTNAQERLKMNPEREAGKHILSGAYSIFVAYIWFHEGLDSFYELLFLYFFLRFAYWIRIYYKTDKISGRKFLRTSLVYFLLFFSGSILNANLHRQLLPI